MMKIIYLIIMTILGSFGSLFLKKSANSDKKVLLNINFYLGGILYFLSALLNIVLLRIFDYSTLLPLTSLTYVWSLILAKIFLNEYVSIKKIVGISVLIFGIILILK